MLDRQRLGGQRVQMATSSSGHLAQRSLTDDVAVTPPPSSHELPALAKSGLIVEGVRKSFGPVTAVDRVELNIPRGEFLTLLGPSGSGKTSLLMMIAGFVLPDEGRILLDRREITRTPPNRRNFGMVFQGYALFPRMSVRSNIAFPLKVRRKAGREIARRVEEMLGLVQLQGLADRLPRELSGGQQQRVALARALSFAPDILLLDEPLSALDRKLRQEMQVELKDLHRRVGTTFLYVTHDQEEALAMSDRIGIMHNGRLVQVGSPTELYERPQTAFVAQFLGASNFIKGRVTRRDARGFVYRVGNRQFHQLEANSSAAADGATLLTIRPEKLRVSSLPDKQSVNTAPGQIASVTYLGSNIRLSLEVEDIGPMVASLPAWRCSLQPEVGAQVTVSWDSDATSIVEDQW
jgi:spermidine/putrescine ABC transporter ATP-binding subunit